MIEARPRHRQLLLGLHLCRKAVAVPAEPALDPPAPHRLVAGDHVLHVAGEEVAVVGEAVGERRPVVEDVLVVVAARGSVVAAGGSVVAAGGSVVAAGGRSAVAAGNGLGTVLNALLEGLVGAPPRENSPLDARRSGLSTCGYGAFSASVIGIQANGGGSVPEPGSWPARRGRQRAADLAVFGPGETAVRPVWTGRRDFAATSCVGTTRPGDGERDD